MLKDQTVTNGFNLFSIASFETQCQLSTISVDFTAPFNLNKTSNSIVPAFCLDGNYFTPSFILPREKEYYLSNSSFEKICFEQRIRKVENMTQDNYETGAKHCSIEMALPDSKYCQVCKTTFSQYFQHIQSELHRLGVQNNTVNKYIVQLCSNHEKTQKYVGKRGKCKNIQKNKENKISKISKQNKVRLRSARY